jgi:hypothetical protein
MAGCQHKVDAKSHRRANVLQVQTPGYGQCPIRQSAVTLLTAPNETYTSLIIPQWRRKLTLVLLACFGFCRMLNLTRFRPLPSESKARTKSYNEARSPRQTKLFPIALADFRHDADEGPSSWRVIRAPERVVHSTFAQKAVCLIQTLEPGNAEYNTPHFLRRSLWRMNADWSLSSRLLPACPLALPDLRGNQEQGTLPHTNATRISATSRSEPED